MAEVGPKAYMDPEFWRQYWQDYFAEQPRAHVLAVSEAASPQKERIWLQMRCLEHDSKSGRCPIYDKRPEPCKRYPSAKQVRKASTRRRCPLAAHLWRYHRPAVRARKTGKLVGT